MTVINARSIYDDIYVSSICIDKNLMNMWWQGAASLWYGDNNKYYLYIDDIFTSVIYIPFICPRSKIQIILHK